VIFNDHCSLTPIKQIVDFEANQAGKNNLGKMNSELTPFREKLRHVQSQHPLFQRPHPFWRDCFQGRLAVADLGAWGLDVYPLIRDFARLYTLVAAKCESERTLTFLAETIFEETGSGLEKESHPTLFRNFLNALDVPDDTILTATSSQTAQAVREFCRKIAREDSFLAGLTLLGLGIERPLPHLFQLLLRAFPRHYHLPANAVKYFAVHTVADVKHSQIAARVVAELAQTPAAQARVCEVLFQLWDLQQAHLDERYEAAQRRTVSGNLMAAAS
jgi:pyrroloquinoline quinone (PQQ) biosynthesis protein C